MNEVIPMAEMYPLIEEMLKAKGSVTFTVSGWSMQPMLYNRRDSVTLVSPPSRLKKYDLPFYRLDNGRFFLHRVIRINVDGTYECRGDNRWESENNIRPDQIIGIVKSFTRNNKKVDVDKSLGYFLYTRTWGILHYFKKFYKYLLKIREPFKTLGRIFNETVFPQKIRIETGDNCMKDILFRMARKSDIKAIQQLNFDLIAYENTNFHAVTANKYYYTSDKGEEFLNNCREKGFLYVAVCDREIVGYIRGNISNSESRNFPVGNLNNIYVIPEYRNSGIGSKFISLFKNYCKENNCWNINVSFMEENISAERFYRKHGFLANCKTYMCNIEE